MWNRRQLFTSFWTGDFSSLFHLHISFVSWKWKCVCVWDVHMFCYFLKSKVLPCIMSSFSAKQRANGRALKDGLAWFRILSRPATLISHAWTFGIPTSLYFSKSFPKLGATIEGALNIKRRGKQCIQTKRESCRNCSKFTENLHTFRWPSGFCVEAATVGEFQFLWVAVLGFRTRSWGSWGIQLSGVSSRWKLYEPQIAPGCDSYVCCFVLLLILQQGLRQIKTRGESGCTASLARGSFCWKKLWCF